MSGTHLKIMSYFFESGTNRAGTDLKGSLFRADLQTPISVPKSARDVFVKVHSAEIWNTFPNIESEVNDTFTFIPPNFVPIVIKVPTGAYNVDGLNLVLQNGFSALQYPPDYVRLEEFVEQNKVIMVMKVSDVTFSAVASSIRTVIGFTTDRTSVSGEDSRFVGDTIAAFNVVNKLFLQTNLVSNGIPFNGFASQAIAKIPITKAPGSQFNFEPFNAIEVGAPELRGSNITHITFWLTDENNNPVDTNGESWGFALQIGYTDIPQYNL